MIVGNYGSIAHIMSNEKVLDKQDCAKKIYKEGIKSELKAYATIAATAGVSASSVALLQKFKPSSLNGVRTLYHNLKSNIGDSLSKVTIDGKGNLKEIVKNSSQYRNFNSLSTPAKAAVGTAIAVTSLILPLLINNVSAKSAAIEGQHEVK